MAYQQHTLHNAASATGTGKVLTVDETEVLCVHFVDTGTPAGTLSFEGTPAAGGTMVAVPMEKADGTLVTSTTTPGYFRLPLNSALYEFQARISVFTSGAFTVLAGERIGR